MRTIILTAVALSGLALAGCESRVTENGTATLNVSDNAAATVDNAGDSIENGASDLVNGASNLAAEAGDVIQNTAADVGNAAEAAGREIDNRVDINTGPTNTSR